METTMPLQVVAGKAHVLSLITIGLAANLFIIQPCKGDASQPFSGGDHYHDKITKMQAFKSSLTRRELASSSVSPSYFASAPAPAPEGANNSTGRPTNVYQVTSYGADPSGKSDSTQALLKAISEAINFPSDGFLTQRIANLGGAWINLEGGNYLISQPLRLPVAYVGNLVGRLVSPMKPKEFPFTVSSDNGVLLGCQCSNCWSQASKCLPIILTWKMYIACLEIPPASGFQISGGTLRASDNFPTDGFLIDLSAPQSNSSSSSSYSYEFITLRDLMLDCNYRGGGISVVNSLRTSIDNCYIAHFSSCGIFVQSGHETYIRNSFLGQHITAGADPGERNFSGTGITLIGNDNAVTDTVIFSAAIGVMVSGQANTLSGVHCYNKASGFGGTGIYLKLPGLTQTRIINCYMDYTGIVAEDPVQLSITNSFFLGDAFILLKSINGIANGVNVVDNMFSGSNKGVDSVQLDQSNGPFNQIEQVVVDRNNVKGMNLRATVARGSAQGNGTSWTVDFNPVLLFPNLINHVQYSLLLSATSGGTMLFPNHALRNTSNNRVVVESDVAVSGSVFVTADQGGVTN